MNRRQLPTAVMLAVAALLVVAGVALWSTAAALIAAGVLLAGWTVLLVVPVQPRGGERR